MTTPNQHQSNKSEFMSSDTIIDWANIIKQWKTSGLPQAAYCEANKINVSDPLSPLLHSKNSFLLQQQG